MFFMEWTDPAFAVLVTGSFLAARGSAAWSAGGAMIIRTAHATVEMMR